MKINTQYYSSDLSIWISVDPMADKYPHQSNYVYCSNNPIKIIDPNGEEEWNLAENGILTKRENGRTDIDIVYAKNKDGDAISRSYKAGSINQSPDSKVGVLNEGTADERHYTTNYMLFSDKDIASDFFEFAAENTDVEWGMNSNNSNSEIFVGTSHQSDFNAVPIFIGGTRIHSHPHENDKISSGFHGSDWNLLNESPQGSFKVYETFNRSYIQMDNNHNIRREPSHNLQKTIQLQRSIINPFVK